MSHGEKHCLVFHFFMFFTFFFFLQNILIDEIGHCKLTDFGLSARVPPGHIRGVVYEALPRAGKPSYMVSKMKTNFLPSLSRHLMRKDHYFLLFGRDHVFLPSIPPMAFHYDMQKIRFMVKVSFPPSPKT